MAQLHCSSCQLQIYDGHGKVMVDRRRFEGPGSSVDRLVVICDDCLANVDGLAERMHRLWELDWLKGNYLWINAQVLTDLASESPEVDWSPESIRDFISLGSVVLPDQAREPAGE